MQQLWFSIFDISGSYKGPESEYIEPVNFEWSKVLQENFEIIRSEFYEYFNQQDLLPYFNSNMVTAENGWRTIALKTWSVELYKNQKKFPKTTELLNRFPEIISASFNLLEPQSKILPHCGDTNAIYRCHLGISIPGGLPECGFKVKDRILPWKEKEWLVFVDAHNHEAFNNTDKPRIILLLDVLRNEFKDRKQVVTSTVLTSLFIQKRAMSYKFIHKASPLFIKVFTKTLRPFAYLAIQLSNILRIY